jgi:hypothetical protein
MIRRLGPRAGLTVVTVLAYLAGATHMAFVAHTLSSTGAVVEASDKHRGGHVHQAVGSVCEESAGVTPSWGAKDSCEAVACSRMSVRALLSPALHADSQRSAISRQLELHETAWTAPPLVVAPKASPPGLG